MTAISVDYKITGQGPALYMVHGIGSRKTTWDALTEHIKDRFTCIAYDLRGHGASPIPATPYTLDQLVEDLEALRAKLGHEKIHIIGHSLGGMIGPAYARAYPQHTLSLSLLSTAAGRSDDDRAKLYAVIGTMKEKGVAPVLGTLLNRWFTDDFIAARPDAIEARTKLVNETPEQVFLSVFWIYAKTEMAPWLSEITCPCLVLTGELDGGCNPRLNQFIASELADAELIILENLKHAILVEDTDRVAIHVRDFLLRHC